MEKASNPPLATVVVPVKNAGPILAKCLEAVAAQRAPFPFEVLCIDSGSTDGSLEVIQKAGARLLQIPPSEFGHGKTRNQAIRACRTPFVAMITHDAVPADSSWLSELVQPMLDDERIAGVFGPHIPHPDCNPAEAYMLKRHFAGFGDKLSTVAIEPTQQGWAHYCANQSFYRFFSDNNAGLRRSVWELFPYPEVDFMEDQLWAAAILEAGYSKAFAPKAVVHHSHNYPLVTLARRGFDEARFFRRYFENDYQQALGERLRGATGVAKLDARTLLADNDKSLGDKLRWLPYVLTCQQARAVGAYFGDRAALLPEGVVRRVSQHHALRGDSHERSQEPSIRSWATEQYQSLSRSKGKLEAGGRVLLGMSKLYRQYRHRGLARVVSEMRKTARPGTSKHWWEGGAYPYLDASPRTEERREFARPDPKHLVLNWVLPPFGQGSGGHLNIFRMIHHLERRGHTCRVYLQDARGYLPDAGVVMQRQVREWFAPIQASVQHLGPEMEQADLVLATSWVTAYPVRASQCAPRKAYFIQDYEPLFYATGAESQLAEDTYRFGFFGITAGSWLEELVKSRYGMQAMSFPLAVEHRDYWPDRSARPKQRRLFAYLRPATQRRAFELLALALRRIHAEFPDVEIHAAGQSLAPSMLPVPFVGHGVLQTEQLRNLYSSCSLALCVSLTNYSLLPQEVVACGCPVVDIDGENTRHAYPPGAIVLAPPSVEGIASAAGRLLSDADYHRQQVERGLEYVKGLSWERSAELVECALQQAVRDERETADEACPLPVRRLR